MKFSIEVCDTDNPMFDVDPRSQYFVLEGDVLVQKHGMRFTVNMQEPTQVFFAFVAAYYGSNMDRCVFVTNNNRVGAYFVREGETEES
jgi:hypothetical protein